MLIVLYSHKCNAKTKPPMNMNIQDQTVQPNVNRKRKCEGDITQSVFQCSTVQEFCCCKSQLLITSMSRVPILTLKPQRKVPVSISTLQDFKILSSFSRSVKYWNWWKINLCHLRLSLLWVVTTFTYACKDRTLDCLGTNNKKKLVRLL